MSDPITLLEYCRQLGAGGVQMPLGVRDEAYTRRLREEAESSGMFVEGIVSPPSGPAAVPGTDLARMLRTVRSQAQKTLPRVSRLPPTERAEFVEQNIRQSLNYAGTELGL